MAAPHARTRTKKIVAPAARTVDRVFEHLLRQYAFERDVQMVMDLNGVYGRVLEDREPSDTIEDREPSDA